MPEAVKARVSGHGRVIRAPDVPLKPDRYDLKLPPEPPKEDITHGRVTRISDPNRPV